MDRVILHIVGGDSRTRAQQARVAFALGHHAEVYATPDELLDRPPAEGVILAADPGSADGARTLLRLLDSSGICLPLVLTASNVEVERVVDAIRAGAFDYLILPLEEESFARRLRSIIRDGALYVEQRRSELVAQQGIQKLSRRERQVLALLSTGRSNKEIAERLELSPRTVEIHRGNMMKKMGADHVADVIRAWIASGLDSAAQVTSATAGVPRLRIVRAGEDAEAIGVLRRG